MELLIENNVNNNTVVFCKPYQEFYFYTQLMFSLAVLTSIILRVFWTITEYLYVLKSPLPITKDFRKIVEHNFSFNRQTGIFIFLLVITLIWLWPTPDYKAFLQNTSMSMMFACIIALGTVYYLQIEQSKFSNLLNIRKSNLLDYGSGMAYSYYHGYLEIIGPTHGDLRKGITERLDNYEDTEGVYIPVKRLFIIVPINSYIPPQLSDGTNGKLIPSNSLPALKIDRAGVKNRSYSNMVYKLSGKNRWYVCVEGATPVLTLNECLQFEPSMKYLREETLIKFYNTLKIIIHKHEKTRNKFEVILYNNNENLADVLERRIEQILAGNN